MIGIKGLGYYLPDKKVPLASLAPTLTPAQLDKIGNTCALIEEKISATDMAVIASEAALEEAGVEAKAIDMIIYCQSSVKDYLIWQPGGMVQDAIGAYNASFFDLYQGCCSFAVAMRIAKSLMTVEEGLNHVLVCAGERWDKCIGNRVVGGYTFSDGGSAALLQKGYERNVLKGFADIGNGSLHNVSKMRIGGQKGFGADSDVFYDITDENPEGLVILKETNLSQYAKVGELALSRANFSVGQVDYLIVPNGRLDFSRKLINVFGKPTESSNYSYMAATGDMSSADFAVNYKRALDDDKIKPGNKVLYVAQGAGMIWTSAAIEA